MADISQKASDIRNSVKGKDVREALASGIETINIETENTTARQTIVEQEFAPIEQNETARIANESARVTAETSRENVEALRVAAEASRQSNEDTRQTNEIKRENVVAAMKMCEPYNTEHTYHTYNKAIDTGSTYECINPVTEGIKGVKPSTDNGTNWLCIAAKGSDGVGGDMFKSVYDTNNSGVVDDAEKLGGQLPADYAKQDDLAALSQTVASDKAENVTSFATKLDKNGGTLQNYSEVASTNGSAAGAVTLDVTNGNVFNLTLTGATTLTFTTPVASGKECSFTLYLNQGATAYSVIFPSSLKWDNDSIPDLSSINKTNIMVFTTVNGGTRWYGRLAMGNLVT